MVLSTISPLKRKNGSGKLRALGTAAHAGVMRRKILHQSILGQDRLNCIDAVNVHNWLKNSHWAER